MKPTYRAPKRAVWLSQKDLEWLLATLLLGGDPLKLRVPFDEALRQLKDEAERLRDAVKVANSQGFIEQDDPNQQGQVAKKQSPKKPKKAKLTVEQAVETMTLEQLEELARCLD